MTDWQKVKLFSNFLVVKVMLQAGKFYSSRELVNKIKSEGIPISERTIYRLIERKIIIPDYVSDKKRIKRYYFSEENVRRTIERLKEEKLHEELNFSKIDKKIELREKSIEDIIREAYEKFCEKIVSIEGEERIQKLKAYYKKIQSIEDYKERSKMMGDFLYAAIPFCIKNIEDYKIRSEAENFFLRMLREE
ncbi:MAG: hypothetical protein ACP5KW_12095 [Thermoproteota archaeon]